MPLNYEQIFGDDFIPILQAIEKGLPDQVETMLLGQIDKMMFEVSIFSDNITKTVASLSASGVKPAQIQNIIGNDMAGGGKIFGGLRNSVKEEIVNGMNQASRLGQYEEYGPRDSYAWVTVGGHKICADCDSNEGAVKSHDKWVSEGLPGSGWSLCGGYCYCVLDPIGKIDSKVQAPKEIKPEKAATVRKPSIKGQIGASAIDKLLGTKSVYPTGSNVNKVTGRLKFDAVREFWNDLYGSKKFQNDLNKYEKFLKSEGLLDASRHLNDLWVDQILDGEALIRYLTAEINDSKVYFSKGKYLGNDPIKLDLFKLDVLKYASSRFKKYSIDDLKKVIQYNADFNRNMLKRYGLVDKNNMVTVYRGVSYEYYRISGAKYPRKIGHEGEMLINSAESWSTNKLVAERFASVRFGGVVYESKVPIDRVMNSNFSFSKGSKYAEAEIVIGGKEPLKYKVVEAGHLN